MKKINVIAILVMVFCGHLVMGQANDSDGLSSSQQQKLEARIKLFGLDDPAPQPLLKEGLKGEVRGSNTGAVIAALNDNLEGAYLARAQSILGKCAEGSCLRDRGLQRILRDENQREHCYPTTDCDYYQCMENQYRCMEVDVPYFKKLARPTCKAYKSNIKKGFFSAKGEEWIYTVMVCLQKGLFEECSLEGNCPVSENNNKTCEHITEFTLSFHPSCYVNSGVGVCHLPLKDQANIWRTVGPFLTKRERREAFKVVRHCLFGSSL